jgi:hypothetical protein
MSFLLRRYIRESLLAEALVGADEAERIRKKWGQAADTAEEAEEAAGRSQRPQLRALYLAGEPNIAVWIEAAWKEPEMFLDPAAVRYYGDSPTGKFFALQEAVRLFGKEFKQKEPRLIGTGSSRYVYDLKDGTVLKLALDNKGIAQNSVEAFAGRDPSINRILAQVEDSSDEFVWLISEKVQPLYKPEFEALTGIPWGSLKQRLEEPAGSQRVVGGGCLTGDEFIAYLKNYLEKYKGMLVDDILKIDSWGKTDSGCAVLLDYGASEAMFKKLYRRG